MKTLQKQVSMTQSKAANTTTTQTSSHECCMCGDYGFSYELFQCKVCQFRSQHRYCSNLYPNVADSQRICNWCLSDAKEKSQNSSNSSSSFKTDVVSHDSDTKIRPAKSPRGSHEVRRQTESGGRSGSLILRRRGGATMQLAAGGPVKKQRSIEASPSPSPSPSPVSGRKRIITAAAKEAERLRRTRSEDIAKVGVTKPVFRNKVRRYKLLEEVSS